MKERELKFRVWYDGEKMHYDYPINFKDWGINSILRDMQECAGELMQYIGIKDDHDKEVYEGDIVMYWSDLLPENKQRGVVMFNKGHFWIKNEREYSPNYKEDFESFYNIDMCREVVGNIYENPELVEEMKMWFDGSDPFQGRHVTDEERENNTQ